MCYALIINLVEKPVNLFSFIQSIETAEILNFISKNNFNKRKEKYDVREQKWKISATDKQKSTIQKRCLGQSLTVSVSNPQCHN